MQQFMLESAWARLWDKLLAEEPQPQANEAELNAKPAEATADYGGDVLASDLSNQIVRASRLPVNSYVTDEVQQRDPTTT